MTKFTEKKFNIGELKGISARNIEEHLKLYAGYVKHANLILEKITAMRADEQDHTYEINEMQRRFGFEFGGIKNHELYFELLEGGAKEISEGALKAAITSEWGSFENWIARFKEIAMTRGIGWAVLYQDTSTGALMNAWVDEQHLGQLAGAKMIFAIDMWEHSFVADYQPSGKKQYVEDFLANVNWSVAEKRFQS